MSWYTDATPEQRARHAARSAAWRRANPDRLREQRKTIRLANPKKYRAHTAAWRAANPDKVVVQKKKQREQYWADPETQRKRSLAWNRSHPEQQRATRAAWSAANPALVNAKTARRRAHKLAQSPLLTNEERAKIIGFYAEARAMTEMSGVPYHVDHIKPLSKGGLHHPDNLQVLLGRENLRKGAKYYD